MNVRKSFMQLNNRIKLILVISIILTIISLFWCFSQIISVSSANPDKQSIQTSWSQYFWPENIIAEIVVVFQLILFLAWVGFLGYLWWRFTQSLRQIKECEDVSRLFPEQQPVKSPKSKKTTNQPDVSELQVTSQIDRNKLFLDFCEEKGLDHKTPLAEHIRTLFNSGQSENRLEIGDLLKHTTNVIFRENNLLRNVLSVFIVIGLFGTLFGLADSLANMHIDSKTNAVVGDALQGLLSHLKGAFAPSICGILFTILGIFIQTIYMYLVCNPLKSDLEYITLNTWVPKLFPATTQKLVKTLELSEEQIYKNLHSIEKVADFAVKMETKVGTLESNIESTNNTLVSLTNSGSKIDQVVKTFSDSVKSLTTFQDEIKKLYEQILNESNLFQHSIAATIDDSSEFQKDSVKLLDEYDERIQSHLKTLNSYEESYLTSRREIEAKIEEVLNTTRQAFDATSEKDRQVLEEMGKAIVGKLDSNLSKIATELTDGLTSLKLEYTPIQNALLKAAEKISGSYETVDSRMTSLVNKFENALSRLEIAFNDSVDQMDKRISKQITEYTTSIAQNKPVATPEIIALNNNLTNLANTINEMNQNTRKPLVANKKNWLIPASVGVLVLFSISVCIALGYQINLSRKQMDQSRKLNQAINQLTVVQKRLLNALPTSNKQVKEARSTLKPTAVPNDNY